MPAIKAFNVIRKQQGFTLFELVVVVLLVGVFMTFAIDRMLRIQIAAERVSVQQTIAALKSAVTLQVAEMVVNSGLNSITTLENTNPMNYLQELPYNYSGLKSDQEVAHFPPASWYYDPLQNILVYRVKNTPYFTTSLAGTPRIRLKIEVIYGQEVSHRKSENIRGVTVKSMDDYSWKLD
ncbi:MAG: prepilin-type N-terminal cleavage/methylation domain-containing protein [Gammaproteobacteria bacterium]|nr:prepilin-type N-terminal cleavage/methylation domain-containing protein [Gammaproteobacteria bacterium]